MMGKEPALSRKDFFRYAFARLAGGVADAIGPATTATTTVKPAPVASARSICRPPGALTESEFLARCTRCDDCLKACPHWVIRKAGAELGERVAGTPMLMPRDNPCLFCDGLPCIAACTTGALAAPVGVAKIGVARVQVDACYMTKSQPCDYCQKICPERPRAIRVSVPGQPAVVDAASCTGCGHCAQLCPANAIRIEDHRSERG